MHDDSKGWINKFVLQDIALAQTCDNVTDNANVADMFIGEHLSYQVGECKLVSE
jgi:hypothetical protein